MAAKKKILKVTQCGSPIGRPKEQRATLVGLGAILLAVMVVDRLVNRSQASLRRGWYLSAVLAGILGIAWVASLPLN